MIAKYFLKTIHKRLLKFGKYIIQTIVGRCKLGMVKIIFHLCGTFSIADISIKINYINAEDNIMHPCQTPFFNSFQN